MCSLPAGKALQPLTWLGWVHNLLLTRTDRPLTSDNLAGYGLSDHPDGVAIVQQPFDAAILASIIRLARNGGVPGSGRRFRTIVYVGHSYGSRILNQLLTIEPDLVDAAVFSGVCSSSSGSSLS